ncbi:hypothetical protein P344_03885 [Spiroplasma mirum ATCC 29335]|uniref:Uncharacterized protein n=1 Tax=Spiroplasma mirum ATCC 29335 TaxID=838561 RepID=W6AN19_9MOLU|nr:hypothetical protein [Spiroplasma mirum]AHI58115.1 hypothetical protein P344_03885 [Spiroplasma mirum ATCC 29335]
MKDNEIKILKIKPIKETTNVANNPDQLLVVGNHPNSHFFNQSSVFAATAPISTPVNQSERLTFHNREVKINLDNPNAINILKKQTNHLEQEKLNFHQRVNKIKDVFDEAAFNKNDEYLKNFNQDNKVPVNLNPIIAKRAPTTDQTTIDQTNLREQARMVAKKILAKEQATNQSVKLTSEPLSKVKQLVPNLFNPSLPNTRIKEVKYSENSNDIDTEASNQPYREPAPELNNYSVLTSPVFKEKEQELDLQIMKPNYYAEADVMEWDPSKRPNFNSNPTVEKVEKPAILTQQAFKSEIAKLKEQEPPEANPNKPLEFSNFYNRLFNDEAADLFTGSPTPAAPKLFCRIKVKTKNTNPSTSKITTHPGGVVNKTIYETSAAFNHNFKIKRLANGRQKINQITKNFNLIWNNPMLLFSRASLLLGFIMLLILTLAWDTWRETSSFDLYTFFKQAGADVSFLSDQSSYWTANRIFLMIVLAIYLGIAIVPLVSINHQKSLVYVILPINILVILFMLVIYIYGYAYWDDNFELVRCIFQWLSLFFLMLAMGSFIITMRNLKFH